MPKCQECKEDADELFTIKVARRKRRVCEDCLSRIEEEQEIAAEAEGVMQGMMEYKGR